MDDAWIGIASETLSARINPFGAELSSLRDAGGRELMTAADPAVWAGRAPLLFPIVGRLVRDSYRLDGRDYPLPPHGFARHSLFALVERSAHRVVFRLSDTASTRIVYPFAFQLDAAFGVDAATLAIDVTLTNSGDRTLPASFGFHPAFAWPLPYGAAKEAHRIHFESKEIGPITALEGGLVRGKRPSPIRNDTLWLRDELFTRDALIWERVESRSLSYGTMPGPQLRIDFPDTRTLGIWTKPGAQFLCIEPWHGIADGAGFTGEIWDKPEILLLTPGAARVFSMRVTLRR